MYCTRKVTDDLTWVGADDRRLAMFEGVYSVEKGVSYNSYLLLDDVTVLFDTVDSAVEKTFSENVEHTLAGRRLDYVVVHHMEPDHSATLRNLLLQYPEVTVVCNSKIKTMIEQFFGSEMVENYYLVSEGSKLNTGHHELIFLMAPMVHWPEVMVSYDTADHILFSADAFGTFGALNGALFNDEVNFWRDYLDEARRYYTNIVGKYGSQVQALLKKAAGVQIDMICPLHGFVWRSQIGDYIDKYQHWSSYQPEADGVVIVYASVYGNTENAANILACKLRDEGVQTKMFDVSVTAASEIVAACFQYSHIVLASTTYNAGIFVTMEAFLHDLKAHNLQNRTFAIIENGSWAPTSGNLMKQIVTGLKGTKLIEQQVSIKSALNDDTYQAVNELAEAIIETMPEKPTFQLPAVSEAKEAAVDAGALEKINYGLFVLTTKAGGKENGCIINTAMQITSNPHRIVICVNKNNYTHDLLQESGIFNLSILDETAPFTIFQQFGFQSGRNVDKSALTEDVRYSSNGISYLAKHTNGLISAKVTKTIDLDTHTMFVAKVTESFELSGERSMSYQYYFDHVKPKKPACETSAKTTYVCKICGYVYEGESLPSDYQCPLCKHGPEDFEKVEAVIQEKKKGYVCKICGYVYEGDSLPEDYQCPLCKHGPEDFEPL